jgi:signal transduction histidine kinase/CheY-like chemotaxis protein
MRLAARNGLIVGLAVAALVIVLALVPALLRGYPLVLLMLLAAGPSAAGGGARRPLALLARGALAGIAAAVPAVAAMVFAVEVLGVRAWALLGAASYPPMPPLPRPDLVPGVGWPHEDLLLFLPLLSALLALLWGLALAAPRAGLVHVLAERLAAARASIHRKLVWTLLVLAALATAVGWLGFSALEDIHLQGHRFQLLADWIGHADELASELDAVAVAARLPDPDARGPALAGAERALLETLDHLERAPAHPGIAVSGAALRQFGERYRDAVLAVRAASEELLALARAAETELERERALAEATRAAAAAQRALRERLQNDLRQGLDQTDLQHHASLMALMLLVVLAVAASLLLGQAAATSITQPLRRLEAQLARLGRGDFSRRVTVANRDELGELAARLNAMTVELERLYAAERASRQRAEADGARLAAQNAELERMRAALQAAKAELERRVDERTAELHDVSAQLRQAQKMDALGRLAGGVAHDFNNLLTVINGHCELLLAQLPPYDSRRASVLAIAEAGEHAAGLTRQLLAFSRRQVRAVEVLDLNAVVTDMARLLRRLVGEDIELVTRLSAAPALVAADRAQLQQVLLNLAVNARDAMPHGGQLVIETALVAHDEGPVLADPEAPTGPRVRLTVTDTGCGMDAATQARLFEPFFTTKPEGRGTGLGLATVYGIVRQSGGGIRVQSAPGRGSRFEIDLPRAAAPAAATPVEDHGPAAGGATILLVEDEEKVRDLTRLALERWGYTVLAARDGREALARAMAYPGPIHLLVTDVVLPGMNGRELAERLMAARPELRVLYASGYTDDAVVRHGVREGAPFLQKPFTFVSLQRTVQATLAGSPRPDPQPAA